MRISTLSRYLAHKLSESVSRGRFHGHFSGLLTRPTVGQPVLVHHRFRRRKAFFLGSFLGLHRSFPLLTLRLFNRPTLVQVLITLPSRRVRDFQFLPIAHPHRTAGHRAFFR